MSSGHVEQEMQASRACRVGKPGGFRAFSVFGDPAGDLPMVERHHRHYDDRGIDWYAGLASRFKGRRRVIDVGGGPGLLAAALREAGVQEVCLVDRDEHFLSAARNSGAHIAAHDLNWPFAFLPSGHYDGAVSHHALDYLAPVARRGVLRELGRVVAPGGLVYLALRHDGPAGGDPARPQAIDTGALRQLAADAGFRELSVRETPRVINLLLERHGSSPTAFPAAPLTLPDGAQVRPWREARPVFADGRDNAWDHLSRRDFTLLTGPAKDEVRFGGKLVAYYTGYRTAADGEAARAVCRAVSADGRVWHRDPKPVLNAGPAGAWDDGGVAAGSVVLVGGRLRLYYSGRGRDGHWAGIGIAESNDGIAWRGVEFPTLGVGDFSGLRHLALADVLRRRDGTWLMHLEGMHRSRWAVFQALSEDGIVWRPKPGPLLTGDAIPWAGADVANPKCVELGDGLLVLGFNASGPQRDFQLGLATSQDGTRWQPAGHGPVRCAVGPEWRIESLFMTRDAWERPDRRAYYFVATSAATHESSDAVFAEADDGAAWPAEPWRSDRLDLYRVVGNRLKAQPGVSAPGHALRAEWGLDGEIQCSGRIAEGAGGGGGVRITLLDVDGVERTALDTADHAAGDQPVAWTVRVLRPRWASPELAVRVWRGEVTIHDEQHALTAAPAMLAVSVAVPREGSTLTLDHLDVWQVGPDTAVADAHVYAGLPRADDPLLPDISADDLLARLDEADIEQALAAPYGASRRLDGFDELARAALTRPGTVHPLLRLGRIPERLEAWTLDQLELLWQQRVLFGLKVHLALEDIPPAAVLRWLARRELPSLWHASNDAHLDILERDVLPHVDSPVLLSHFAGYPADRRRYDRAIAMLDRWPQVHLVTSAVFFAHYLRVAALAHPDRVLLGSDHPAVDPVVAQTAVRRLGLPPAHEALVMGGSLRHLLARAVRARERAIADGDVRFPSLPEDAEDLARQGFHVSLPTSLPASESHDAKALSAGYGVGSSCRERDKPWAHVIAELALDLRPASVLEFGCNVGRNLVAIRGVLPKASLTGLDVNAEAVRKGARETGFDLRVGDEHHLQSFADGAFDLVFTVSVLDHVADPDPVLEELVRCAAQAAYFLEVALPVEGKVVRHYDHAAGEVRDSTGASYSWDLERRLRAHPRVWRLDRRPVYLHDESLGPYYASYLAWLEPPGA